MVELRTALKRTRRDPGLWVSTICGDVRHNSASLLAPPSEIPSTSCGGERQLRWVFGDTTEVTGRALVAARVQVPEIPPSFMKMFDRYKAVVEAHKTTGLFDSQRTMEQYRGRPVLGRGEGARHHPEVGKRNAGRWRLDQGPRPTHPGLWFMDSSSAAAEMVTLCAASGFAVHTFPTGQGNVIGNPILPVIKLTANPRTQRTMSEHMDLDVTGLLQKKMNMDEAGWRCSTAIPHRGWAAHAAEVSSGLGNTPDTASKAHTSAGG